MHRSMSIVLLTEESNWYRVIKMRNDLTKRAAEFVVGLEYGHIPDKVVQIVKYSFIDTISAGIIGSGETVFIKAREYVNEEFPKAGNAFVFGSGHNYLPENAALLNGIACHAVDYDDVHEAIHGHPSAVLWPTIFAFGNDETLNGEKAITAYVAAVEIMGKLGGGIDNTHYSSGWHATSTLGVIGAAIASSKIIGLTEAETANAIGIACSFAAGLRCNFGYMTKCVHVGHAAQDGIMAAKMARKGMTASNSAIEDNCGFVQCFSDESIALTASLFDELGQAWTMLEPGLKTKYYPCCAGTHVAVVTASEMYLKHGSFLPEQVDSIICRCKPWQPTVLRYSNPSTPIEAKFSMQYCVASMLVYGALTLDSFTQEAIADNTVRRLMEKITMEPVSLDSYQTLPTVEICLTGSEKMVGKSKYAIGHPMNPMTVRQRAEKLQLCAKDKLTENQIETVFNAAKELQSQKRISPILKEVETYKK
ncbi:MAG TPA: MmgE/PrpD family protein [Clostridia bacterium]|nr:MmgE/PrpD family protein [Clostridia bacterium]